MKESPAAAVMSPSPQWPQEPRHVTGRYGEFLKNKKPPTQQSCARLRPMKKELRASECVLQEVRPEILFVHGYKSLPVYQRKKDEGA